MKASIWLLLSLALSASAKDWPLVSASAGLELARDAAHSWAEDSYLIYLENDEEVDAVGQCQRWGYLFYSPGLDAWRAYSLAGGKIVSAGELDFGFDAPPVDSQWVDSERAFAAAEDKAGRKYREEHAGRLRTMLLIRGAFHFDDPDKSTWTLIYDSERAPSLFVVVDAENGKVVRTWKG